jgi:tetraacyldisaccharide 4'-kinase
LTRFLGASPPSTDSSTSRAPSATRRARLERQLQRLWFDPEPGVLAALLRQLLSPLSGVVSLVARRQRRRIALDKAMHPRPAGRPVVVVIGNLITGGTGKTPLIAALAQSLSARGWRVGLLARGHGGRHSSHRAGLLSHPIPAGAARDWGDEAVLLALQTGRPVGVGHDRSGALDALVSGHDCEVVLSDDGLQHRALHRDIEIAVFDARGAGNGQSLPAGPLREPLTHALLMDAIALNGLHTAAPVVHSRVFRFEVHALSCRPLEGGQEIALSAMAQTLRSSRVHALAGIGQPGRFFEALRQAGLQVHGWVLADHEAIDPNWAQTLPADTLLITSKDAVKCLDWPTGLRARTYEVIAQAELSPSFIDWLEERLRGSPIA